MQGFVPCSQEQPGLGTAAAGGAGWGGPCTTPDPRTGGRWASRQGGPERVWSALVLSGLQKHSQLHSSVDKAGGKGWYLEEFSSGVGVSLAETGSPLPTAGTFGLLSAFHLEGKLCRAQLLSFPFENESSSPVRR